MSAPVDHLYFVKMWRILILISSLVYLIEAKSIGQNNSAILISKYAKVAHWGVTDNDTKSDIQQERSNKGGAMWTHRSDVNVIGSRNVKSEKPKIVYQYAVYRKPSTKIDDSRVEKLPAIGEVIQDRYNPRPYFGYGKIPAKSQSSATYAPPQPATSAPAVAPPPPPPQVPAPSSGDSFDSFPAVFNVPPSTAKLPDLYTSSYTSYNPPDKPMNPSYSDSYPPSAPDSYEPPPPPSGNGDDNSDYKPKEPPVPSYASLGPPLSQGYLPPYSDSKPPQGGDHHSVDAPPSDHMADDIPSSDDTYDHMPDNLPDHMHGPILDHMPDSGMADHMPKHNNGPPDYPPKDEHDIYYPPDFDNGGHGMDVMDHPPKGYKAPDDMMTMDLSPPPSNDNGHHFPPYLYDDHHYDHHVYEEVPHTTTEAMEDKRVSSANYSYYYLGRKLWYIPLYFSIYFIIYVTFLILKAIARHKIQYKHKHSFREARKMTVDRLQAIDDLHRNVTNAIERVQKIYPTFAM